MSYGLGSVSYHYDQLSRMDWEERTFGVLGPYRLSYTYNLASELTGITGPSQFGSVQVGYNYDNNGRLNSVTGSGYAGVGTYASNISYRAFGAVKAMSFGDGRSLSTSYDSRMRPTSWNVSSVLGYNYSYIEHTDKVNYARNVYDSTLDRSYEYDQVGALVFAHSGAEARAAFGIDGTQWGNSDGPYSHEYDYDKQGNMIRRFGWGGEVQGGAPHGGDTTLNYGYSTNKNQRDGLGYDAAGNVTSDGYFNTYNASNQQTQAESGSYTLAQYYDGDGLRVTKYDNGPTTNYLRSTVLGGAVVVEINANNNSAREYVYAGSDLLAVQSGGQVSWVHEDPITKSQRVTDASGNVINTIELDPWGANTSRSSASPFQPQTFTTYIRDGNGQQDAMARRYSPNGRFSQPDPYGGSYNFSDPQSLNRYAYVGNDPVNRKDPSGLDSDFGLGPPPPVPILVPPKGAVLPVITTNTWASRPSGAGHILGDDENLMTELGPEAGGATGGGIATGAGAHAMAPDDPCKNVKATDLDYSQRRSYGGIMESAEEHITRRHINPASPASRYWTDPPQDPAAMMVQVKFYNALTFQFGDRINLPKGSGFAFVLSFPPFPHPMYQGRKIAAWIGTDRQTQGNTRTNTLFLGPDCKTIQTSHPGFPSLPGYGPNPDNP